MFSIAKETAKVEEHLQKLIKLDEGGWTCDIPEVDRQSLVELSQLRKPKLEVRLVLTAMYMLLGIEEENLKVISYLKYLSIRNSFIKFLSNLLNNRQLFLKQSLAEMILFNFIKLLLLLKVKYHHTVKRELSAFNC